MAGLTVTLNIAEQTLLNTQTELATSSNNISNADTPGYAVEKAVQTENPEIQRFYGWVGTGASISTISQARDNFLEQQLMNATASDSQYSSLATELTTIQSAASDSGTNGISEALGNFFDAWSSLAQNPSGSSEQTQVYSAAQNLASAIQSTYSQLSQISDQLNDTSTGTGQIPDTISQVNTLIQKIAQLNTGISENSTATAPANSLIDEQYAAMDSLSKLIPVSFTTNSDGTMNVSTTFSDGTTEPLVTSETVNNTIASTDSFTGGQLGGLQQAATDLTSYMNKFDYFTSTLTSAVNGDAIPGSPVFSGSSASTISANSNFLSGASSATIAGVAQSMSSLQDQTVSFSDPSISSSTLQGYLDSTQQQIGNDVQDANNNQSFYDSLTSELQNEQQSVSGVSMDEEMVNVIQYQQIYQAAAKVVETASTLMSTAINMVQ